MHLISCETTFRGGDLYSVRAVYAVIVLWSSGVLLATADDAPSNAVSDSPPVEALAAIDELRNLYNSLKSRGPDEPYQNVINALQRIRILRISRQVETPDSDDPLQWKNLIRLAREAANNKEERNQLKLYLESIDAVILGGVESPKYDAPKSGSIDNPDSGYHDKERSSAHRTPRVEPRSSGPAFTGKVGNRVNAEKGELKKQSSAKHELEFKGGEVAAVWVKGSEKSTLTLRVLDKEGKVVTKVDEGNSDCVAKWWPAWTATFSVEVTNPATRSVSYFLYTN